MKQKRERKPVGKEALEKFGFERYSIGGMHTDLYRDRKGGFEALVDRETQKVIDIYPTHREKEDPCAKPVEKNITELCRKYKPLEGMDMNEMETEELMSKYGFRVFISSSPYKVYVNDDAVVTVAGSTIRDVQFRNHQ